MSLSACLPVLESPTDCQGAWPLRRSETARVPLACAPYLCSKLIERIFKARPYRLRCFAKLKKKRKTTTILADMACCVRIVPRCAAIKSPQKLPADRADFPIRIMIVIFMSCSTAVLKIWFCSSPSRHFLRSLSSFSRVYTSAPPR